MDNGYMLARGAWLLSASIVAAMLCQYLTLPVTVSRLTFVICLGTWTALVPVAGKAFTTRFCDRWMGAITLWFASLLIVTIRLGDAYHDQLWLSLVYIGTSLVLYPICVLNLEMIRNWWHSWARRRPVSQNQ